MTKKLKLSDLARDLHISTQELVGFYEQRDANGIKKKGVTGLTPEEINLALEHYSQKTQVENFEGYFASKNTPKPAEKKPTEKKPAEKKNSEKKPAEKKPADKKPQAEKKQPAPKNVEKKSATKPAEAASQTRPVSLHHVRKVCRSQKNPPDPCYLLLFSFSVFSITYILLSFNVSTDTIHQILCLYRTPPRKTAWKPHSR